MQNQKLDTSLNMALSLSNEELEEQKDIVTGYEDGIWEVIIRYHGDIRQYESEYLHLAELLADYAIVWITEENLNVFSGHPEIEYVEMPKALSFQVLNGKRSSCITEAVQRRNQSYGEGVFVGIVDSGIDYSHGDFRNPDGTTRISALWDQSEIDSTENDNGFPIIGNYGIGKVYLEEQINEALDQKEIRKRYEIVPERDFSGHGTAVAGIAAGNGRESDGRYQGVASKCKLLVVKLKPGLSEGFVNTGSLMMGIDFCIRMAREQNIPLALNISLGTNFGAHNGMSLLERYIDDVSLIGKNVICIGSGNEGNTSGHTRAVLQRNEVFISELAISSYERNFSLQIWQYYPDEFLIEIVSASGERSGSFSNENRRLTFGRSRVDVYFGEPGPYSPFREILINFYSDDQYLDRGIWQIVFYPEKIIQGNVELWLPSEASLNQGTHFLNASSETTLTIPSTAARAISVAAYDALTMQYADFSGRGYPWANVSFKPDLSAPGVDVITARSGGGYGTFSGTSFAAPFVTGAAALLMEEGIVKGKDPFLYGEKVKAYLMKSARKLPEQVELPDRRFGWGALCLDFDELSGK